MPSPKKKYPYAIVRENSSYQVFDLTKEDYKKIVNGLMSSFEYVEVSIGVIGLSGIQSVIEQKPEPEQPKEKPALPPMSTEERAWYNQLKEMGMFDEDEVEVDY